LVIISVTFKGFNNISVRGAEIIANALTKNIKLANLYLGLLDFYRIEWNRVKDEGVIKIAEALERNNTIVILDLSILFESVERNDIKDLGAKRLAESLLKNSTLNILHLCIGF
jgi:hypothetical protein